ncbi:MAG: hypothetical protein ACJ8CR_00785 [Roseiflexaceae bacterium]
MRGRQFSSDGKLPERELHELIDLLAMRIYNDLGRRAYALNRQDVAELVRRYTNDLVREDQRTIPWLVWDLLQEGMEIELAVR